MASYDSIAVSLENPVCRTAVFVGASSEFLDLKWKSSNLLPVAPKTPFLTLVQVQLNLQVFPYPPSSDSRYPLFITSIPPVLYFLLANCPPPPDVMGQRINATMNAAYKSRNRIPYAEPLLTTVSSINDSFNDSFILHPIQQPRPHRHQQYGLRPRRQATESND